ncbi:MAG: DUF1285 domain-containing protein [Pseudomonadota bacterium]
MSDAGGDAPLPVETWHPDHCGSMDLTIKADGTWWHEGTMMTRAKLVRLFSRVLRRDHDGYVLVTPAEKIAITVEDVPFLAVDYDATEDGLLFRTNVGDRVLLSQEHPMELRQSEALGQLAPYIHVRGKLHARLARSVYYRLVEEAGTDESDDALVIESAGAVFRFPITTGA